MTGVSFFPRRVCLLVFIEVGCIGLIIPPQLNSEVSLHSCDGPASAHFIGASFPFYSTIWGSQLSIVSRFTVPISGFYRELDPLRYNPLVGVSQF